jgi:hypothetical protein
MHPRRKDTCAFSISVGYIVASYHCTVLLGGGGSPTTWFRKNKNKNIMSYLNMKLNNSGLNK